MGIVYKIFLKARDLTLQRGCERALKQAHHV